MFKAFVSCVAILFAFGFAVAQEPDQTAPAQDEAVEPVETASEGAQAALNSDAPDQAGEAKPDETMPGETKPGETKNMLGISILGNEETPTSLVIVPWKSSEIGAGVGVSSVLDDRAEPVDKDVFMRELRYYQIRSSAVE